MATAPRMIVPASEGQVLNVLGEKVTIKTPGDETNGYWSLIEFQSPNGAGAPPHRHPWAEGYYVLEGEIDFSVEGRTLKATAGFFVHVPPGTVHATKITSPSARYLMWATPAGAERFLADLHRDATEMPPNMEKILAIAARHQVEAVVG